MKTLTAFVAVVALLFPGSALTGPTKVGGDFDAKVNVKNVTQVGLGKTVKQRISAGSVECAQVKGDFKSDVKAKNITQVGLGKNVKQSIALGSVVGKGCQ